MNVPISCIQDLRVGDIIVGRLSGLAYVVTDHYGDRATAVRTVDVSNPGDWLRYVPYAPTLEPVTGPDPRAFKVDES